MRIACRDRDQAHELPLGSLHRLLATYPASGLPIIRGSRDWEHGRVCLEVLVTSKKYTAGEWTRMKHVGYTRAENEEVSARMVAGDWEGEEEVNEVKKENPPAPSKAKAPPPEPSPPKLVAKKSPECILSWMSHQMGPSLPQKKNHPKPPLATKVTPASKTSLPKGEGMVRKTPSWAPRSKSGTHGAWRWAPCAVSIGGRRGLSRWNTQITPSLTRLPPTSTSPPPRPPMNTLSVSQAQGQGPALPHPQPSGRHDPKTKPLINPKTNPKLTPKLTPRLNPNQKTAPTLTQRLSQPNDCDTPKMGSQEV